MDDKGQTERGRKAWVDRSTGEVHGSGSGAGGGNPGEDHDQDPMAGAGADPHGGPKPIDEAIERPTDKQEGR